MENAVSFRLAGLCAVALLAGAGCSARDPVTMTPSFHTGTPTNRSTVQSWEINNDPYHTQPGINPGAEVAPLPSGGRKRGFEPYDPLAIASYNALLASGDIDTKYLTCSAKSGVVIVAGSVRDAEQKRNAEQIVRAVPGVTEMRSQLRIVGEAR